MAYASEDSLVKAGIKRSYRLSRRCKQAEVAMGRQLTVPVRASEPKSATGVILALSCSKGVKEPVDDVMSSSMKAISL